MIGFEYQMSMFESLNGYIGVKISGFGTGCSLCRTGYEYRRLQCGRLGLIRSLYIVSPSSPERIPWNN